MKVNCLDNILFQQILDSQSISSSLYFEIFETICISFGKLHGFFQCICDLTLTQLPVTPFCWTSYLSKFFNCLFVVFQVYPKFISYYLPQNSGLTVGNIAYGCLVVIFQSLVFIWIPYQDEHLLFLFEMFQVHHIFLQQTFCFCYVFLKISSLISHNLVFIKLDVGTHDPTITYVVISNFNTHVW